MNDPGPSTPRRGPSWRATLGFVLGLVLLIAAVVVVARSGPGLGQAARAVAGAPLWVVGAVLLAPVLSWLASAGTLWALTRRFGTVGLGEMNALVASAWLLNYLPLKPGLVGRLAYHKRVNGIRVKDSARVLVESLLIAIPCAGVMLVIGLALRGTAALPAAQVGFVAAPAVVLALACVVVPPGRRFGWLLLAVLLRYLDMLVWVGRYAAVFAAVGMPLGLPECVVVASVSQMALLIPIAGNGLGVREWAVGLTAGAAGGAVEPALAADLVSRAAEIALCVPIGLLGARAVAGRFKRTARATDSCARPADRAETSVNPPPDAP